MKTYPITAVINSIFRISSCSMYRSLFNDDDDPISSFPSLKRHTSLGRESDTEEPRFHTMHRLR